MTPAQRSDAWADLFDFLSLAFGYPGDRLYGDLKSGNFTQLLRRCMLLIPTADSLKKPLEALQCAAESYASAGDLRGLESIYISLFEANRDEAPLHLYGYLYDERGGSRMQALQRLQQQYRDFGLELQRGQGAENADHLTVQLEFMAYLYRLQRQALLDNRKDLVADTASGIQSFRSELHWVAAFVRRLENRVDARAFYAPLGCFLEALLSVTAP